VNGDPMSLAFNGTDYTLSYEDSAGGAWTTTVAADKIDTTTVPNTITFNIKGVGDSLLSASPTSGTITIPLDASDITLGYGLAAPVLPATTTSVTLGSATPNVFDLTATTYYKSGEVLTLTDTWDSTASDTELTFGDIGITIDEADFKDALAEGFENEAVGNIGPGAGVPTKLAQIAVVKFTNPDGLSQDGQGYYVSTINSGLPVATVPGNGGTGNFRAGALEMSNVDLSKEFTEMIITQRGFQANTRMITVSDEMLSELISMKR